jgi:alkylated DNA repair dioxygenase AlkB
MEDNLDINGITITNNFISPIYENELISNILRESWNNELSRRTQYYGYKYNHKTRYISHKNFLGPFPHWLDELNKYLIDKEQLKYIPDQIIINEYKPGQGISAHIDQPKIFDEHIYTLSLGSDICMNFSKDNIVKKYFLERRSLLHMEGEGRYKWEHYIEQKKIDNIELKNFPIFKINKIRETRYSITFRKIIFNNK